MSDIKSRYITAADYNEFTSNVVANKVKSEGLVDKSAIAGVMKTANLDKKVAALVAEQDKY